MPTRVRQSLKKQKPRASGAKEEETLGEQVDGEKQFYAQRTLQQEAQTKESQMETAPIEQEEEGALGASTAAGAGTASSLGASPEDFSFDAVETKSVEESDEDKTLSDSDEEEAKEETDDAVEESDDGFQYHIIEPPPDAVETKSVEESDEDKTLSDSDEEEAKEEPESKEETEEEAKEEPESKEETEEEAKEAVQKSVREAAAAVEEKAVDDPADVARLEAEEAAVSSLNSPADAAKVSSVWKQGWGYDFPVPKQCQNYKMMGFPSCQTCQKTLQETIGFTDITKCGKEEEMKKGETFREQRVKTLIKELGIGPNDPQALEKIVQRAFNLYRRVTEDNPLVRKGGKLPPGMLNDIFLILDVAINKNYTPAIILRNLLKTKVFLRPKEKIPVEQFKDAIAPKSTKFWLSEKGESLKEKELDPSMLSAVLEGATNLMKSRLSSAIQTVARDTGRGLKYVATDLLFGGEAVLNAIATETGETLGQIMSLVQTETQLGNLAQYAASAPQRLAKKSRGHYDEFAEQLAQEREIGGVREAALPFPPENGSTITPALMKCPREEFPFFCPGTSWCVRNAEHCAWDNSIFQITDNWPYRSYANKTGSAPSARAVQIPPGKVAEEVGSTITPKPMRCPREEFPVFCPETSWCVRNAEHCAWDNSRFQITENWPYRNRSPANEELLREMMKDNKMVKSLKTLMKKKKKGGKGEIKFNNLSNLEKDFIVKVAENDSDWEEAVESDKQNSERYTVVLSEDIASMF